VITLPACPHCRIIRLAQTDAQAMRHNLERSLPLAQSSSAASTNLSALDTRQMEKGRTPDIRIDIYQQMLVNYPAPRLPGSCCCIRGFRMPRQSAQSAHYQCLYPVICGCTAPGAPRGQPTHLTLMRSERISAPVTVWIDRYLLCRVTGRAVKLSSAANGSATMVDQRFRAAVCSSQLRW